MNGIGQGSSPARGAGARGEDGVWRFLELLAVLVVCVSMAGLLAMRLGIFHAPQIWIVAFLATYAYGRRAPAGALTRAPGAPAWHLVLVVAVALILRLPPFAYLLGGQDEGVYMNMGAELARTGALHPVDGILGSIPGDLVRQAYLQGNYAPNLYLPGVYAVGGGLEFQFYHLFPVWLAMFGSLFGVGNSAYALTFLSLVSLLFFQRLAHMVSGSAKTGLIAALLLAVNPLHAFFSKFPVTEIPTLAFSTMAFTYLLACVDAGEPGRRSRYFWLSLAALWLVFMTRISGFQYIPLLLLLVVIGQVAVRNGEKVSSLLYWSVAALGLYAASVAYGLEWSGYYARDIYRMSFEPLLGKQWATGLCLFLGCCTVVLVALGIASWNDGVAQRVRAVLTKAAVLLPVLVAVFTALALWRAHRLGYTDAYAADPELGVLSGHGVASVRAVSLVATAAYLSPFMLLAFLAASVRTHVAPALKVLSFFVVSFYGYVALLQWFLPYQPYYARYLVSELVPYLLLFVVCFWSALPPGAFRKFMGSMLLLAGVYCGVLSVQQVGDSEHQGLASELDRLASHFDDKDLVVIDRNLASPTVGELKTALVYSYGLSVITAGSADLAPQGYARKIARFSYQDVFFVTNDPSSAPDGFVGVDSVEFLERVYCRGVAMPTSLCTRNDTRLMIFRLPLAVVAEPGVVALEYSASQSQVQTLSGVKQDGRLRSDGSAGFVMFGPYAPLPAGRYTLVVEGDTAQPFTLDVVAGHGGKVFARERLPGAVSAGQGVLARLDFEVPKRVEDLEVRIQTGKGSDLAIDDFWIEYR